ncbi:hypothetical protein PPL_02969 [Heterostelium album PN500]|uniref:Uncharacterized protein n=1 Tax=Heterostelium pallidum (strain ATCC 26659 / Pp 5 / PN500) TaxID=670386 RepID=D3B3K1_HETP5|nr:hypothetical protein PPL_02969 [Heterostelium album PN500]EFA83899.1 hypothetical protein PPL_02969 [Heterostelium album PN500]|eukprot:XP_020436016.1 hypothetical protein PPL_02969 [Heterostelium album PN500]
MIIIFIFVSRLPFKLINDTDTDCINLHHFDHDQTYLKLLVDIIQKSLLKDDKIDHEIKEKLVGYTIKTLSMIRLSLVGEEPAKVKLSVIKEYLEVKLSNKSAVPSIFDVAETMLTANNFEYETYDTMGILDQLVPLFSNQPAIIDRFRLIYAPLLFKIIIYTSNCQIYDSLSFPLGRVQFQALCNEWVVSDTEKVKILSFNSEQRSLAKFMYILSQCDLSATSSQLINDHFAKIAELIPVSLKLIAGYHQSSGPLLNDFGEVFRHFMGMILSSDNEPVLNQLIQTMKDMIEDDPKLFDLLYPLINDRLSGHDSYFKRYFKDIRVRYSVKNILIKKQESKFGALLDIYQNYINGIIKLMTFTSDSFVLVEGLFGYFKVYYDQTKAKSKTDDGCYNVLAILIHTLLLRSNSVVDIVVTDTIVDLFIYAYESHACSQQQKDIFNFLVIFMTKSDDDKHMPFITKYSQKLQLLFNNISNFNNHNIKLTISRNLSFLNQCISSGAVVVDDRIVTIILDNVRDAFAAPYQKIVPLAKFLDMLPDAHRHWNKYRGPTLQYRNINSNINLMTAEDQTLYSLHNKLNDAEKKLLRTKLNSSIVTYLRRELPINVPSSHFTKSADFVGIQFFKDKAIVDPLEKVSSQSCVDGCELPELSKVIWAEILFNLFSDATTSTKWKIRTLPMVSTSILSNNPMKSVEIRSKLTHIGSKFCLFKNPPLHLIDYEIAHIPTKFHPQCINSLQALTQTFDTYTNNHVNSYTFDMFETDDYQDLSYHETFIHYLDCCPSLNSIHFKHFVSNKHIMELYSKFVRDNTKVDHLVRRYNRFKYFNVPILNDSNDYDQTFQYYDDFQEDDDFSVDEESKEHILSTFIQNYILQQKEKKISSVTFESNSIDANFMPQCLHLLNEIKESNQLDIMVDLTITVPHQTSHINTKLLSLIRSLSVTSSRINIVGCHFTNLSKLAITAILPNRDYSGLLQQVFRGNKSLKHLVLEGQIECNLSLYIPNNPGHTLETLELIYHDEISKINKFQIASKQSKLYFEEIFVKLNKDENKSIVNLVVAAKVENQKCQVKYEEVLFTFLEFNPLYSTDY